MVVTDPSEIPSISLDVHKDGNLIETIMLENRAVFKIRGQSPEALSMGEPGVVSLLHESISECHAVFVVDKTDGVVLIDLASEHGTFLNGKKLEANFPTKVA